MALRVGRFRIRPRQRHHLPAKIAIGGEPDTIFGGSCRSHLSHVYESFLLKHGVVGRPVPDSISRIGWARGAKPGAFPTTAGDSTSEPACAAQFGSATARAGQRAAASRNSRPPAGRHTLSKRATAWTRSAEAGRQNPKSITAGDSTNGAFNPSLATFTSKVTHHGEIKINQKKKGRLVEYSIHDSGREGGG